MSDLLLVLGLLYLSLMVFPLMLKWMGLGIVADPMIRGIHWLLLLPFRLLTGRVGRP